jgi:FMN phosphatase YigB (HAD superfamily)
VSGGVRLVCFDWGGVILKHCRSWKEACGVAGIPVRDGHDRADMVLRRRALTQDFQRGALGAEDFFTRLAAVCEGLYTREVISRLVSTPGVETALLSNTNECHWSRHLPRDGEAPEFPTAGLLRHRHASHLLRLAKPEPEIYSKFEAITGYRGGEVLYFDDLAENLVTPRELGWRTHHVDHTGDTASQIREALMRHSVWSDGR